MYAIQFSEHMLYLSLKTGPLMSINKSEARRLLIRQHQSLHIG